MVAGADIFVVGSHSVFGGKDSSWGVLAGGILSVEGWSALAGGVLVGFLAAKGGVRNSNLSTFN